MTAYEEHQLPHRFHCDEYVERETIEEKYLLIKRLFFSITTGRICDFHIQLSDKYTHQVLMSADCEHQIAHYHDERHGHRKSPRYNFAPASTVDEIEHAYYRAEHEIVTFARRKGIIL